MEKEPHEHPRNPEAGDPASESANRDESDAGGEEPTFDEAERTEDSAGTPDPPRDQEPKP